MKLRYLLTCPAKWCRGRLANTLSGRKCSPLSKWAASLCLVGWLRRATGVRDDIIGLMEHPSFVKLSRAVRAKGYRSIPEFNDDPKVTFREVRELVTKLDI